MLRFRKSLVLAVAVMVGATSLAGCAMNVGGSHERGPDERIKKIDARMTKAEKQLGLSAAGEEK